MAEYLPSPDDYNQLWANIREYSGLDLFCLDVHANVMSTGVGPYLDSMTMALMQAPPGEIPQARDIFKATNWRNGVLLGIALAQSTPFSDNYLDGESFYDEDSQPDEFLEFAEFVRYSPEILMETSEEAYFNYGFLREEPMEEFISLIATNTKGKKWVALGAAFGYAWAIDAARDFLVSDPESRAIVNGVINWDESFEDVEKFLRES